MLAPEGLELREERRGRHEDLYGWLPFGPGIDSRFRLHWWERAGDWPVRGGWFYSVWLDGGEVARVKLDDNGIVASDYGAPGLDRAHEGLQEAAVTTADIARLIEQAEVDLGTEPAGMARTTVKHPAVGVVGAEVLERLLRVRRLRTAAQRRRSGNVARPAGPARRARLGRAAPAVTAGDPRRRPA